MSKTYIVGGMGNESKIEKMFWADLEMTGLDEKTCKIIEVAAIITDLDLKPLDEYHRVVYQPSEVLETMDDWCKKTHGASGLTAKIPDGDPIETIDTEIVDFINKQFGGKKVVLCGNSVSQDRKFIDAYMPKLSKRLHYRIVDVSSFKEVFSSKYGLSIEKKDRHRALDDIQESINELKYFLSFVDPKTDSPE